MIQSWTEGNVRVTRMSGDIDLNGFVTDLLAIMDSPEYVPTLDSLVDMQQVTSLHFFAADAHALVNRYRQLSERGGRRMAMLPGPASTRAYARLFQVLSEDAVDVRIFESAEQARDWLGLPSDDGADAGDVA